MPGRSMAACPKCGAHVGDDGKWSPAQHLSQVCTERDKALKEAGELRWEVGSMRAALTKAQDDTSALEARIKRAIETLSQPVDTLREGTLTDAVWRCDAALKILRGES